MKPRKRIGELVLRSENAQALVKFYRNVIGVFVNRKRAHSRMRNAPTWDKIR